MKEQESRLPKLNKNPMTEITNSSKPKMGKLVSRLYRNSSSTNINPNISLLQCPSNQIDPSFLSSSSNILSSQLVASISLRKLKNKLSAQPYSYLQISNGKLLVNRDKSSFAESPPRHSQKNRKMFKKLDKLNHSPMNRILPDQLIDYPIQKQQSNQAAKNTKKAQLSPKNKNWNKCKDSKQDLLPWDFIQLLQQQKKITNQFCYLKKMDNPYDLKIIQFDQNLQRKSQDAPLQYPSQYITISSRGVTYFSQDQSRFVTLQQWKKQANFFKKIIKLDFFKNFKIIKNFSNWKKFIRKSAMKSTIQKLKQKLVYNDKFLRRSLLNIRDICCVMENDVSYCRLDDCQKVATYRQFKMSQQGFIQNQFQRRIFQLQQSIKQVLMKNMSDSMKQFKEQNKITSSIQGKGMPLLIGDQKNLQMPYTKQATLRTQQQKFQKFIKLVDILITHSKVNMMLESTNLLAKKIDQQNENYQKQVVQFEYKNTYKGKQYLQCVLTIDPSEPDLFLRPTKQDLISLFEDIVNRSVVRLCRNHKKISSDIDVLSIIYDHQEQFPKQSQSENLKAIMTSDGKQQLMLNQIMKSVSISYQYILNYVDRFKEKARINFQNMQSMQKIDSLKPKDYEIIKNLIQKWDKFKQSINQINKQHEGPIFQVNLEQFKQKTLKITNQCITKLKQVMPVIFQEAIVELQKNLYQSLGCIQNQPLGIQSLITFNMHKNRISSQVDDYSDRMMEITCLQILMRNMSPNNSQSNSFKKYERQIKQLQSSLNTLRKKLDEADMKNKLYQTRAQDQVKQMIPKNKSRLAELYTKIQIVCRQRKSSRQMVAFTQKKRPELQQIANEFKNICTYQNFLNLEESQSTIIQNFIWYFGIFEKIWSVTYQFENYQSQLFLKTIKSIKTMKVYQKLEQYITIMLTIQKQVNSNKEKDFGFQFSIYDQQAIKNVLQKVQTLKPLIQTIQYLNDSGFGDKQLPQSLKTVLQARNPNFLRLIQVDRSQRKTKQLLDVNAASQLSLFKSFVLKNKRNYQINQKLESVRAFTNFSKQHLNLFKNLTQKFKVYIGQFLLQVDEKIISSNFIIEQTQSRENEKGKNEKNTLQKLKQILILWDQYQHHVQYFEPIYNLTDWKNTQEGKLFISATQQNWKKTYKSYRDSNLSKIITAERIVPSLKQSNQILQSLYSSMNSYFNAKRLQSPRLYYFSDSQIIKIHSENKDFKGFNNYIQKLFPFLKQLTLKQDQLHPTEVVNLDGEKLQLKLGRISNYEVEQMIKVIDEGVKNGVKNSIKNCFIAYQSQQFNKILWIKQYPLQSLIFVSAVYFCKIMQCDYLLGEEDDISKLYNYHLSQIQKLRRLIKQQEQDELTMKKLFVLLTQSLNIRDIMNCLIAKNVMTKQSYEWLKHIRNYYYTDQAYIQYLNTQIPYGNQFVCMANNPLLSTYLNDKLVIQFVNNMLVCNNLMVSKSSVLQQVSIYNAKPHNTLYFAFNSHIQIICKAIEGAWLTGSFVDIFLPTDFDIQGLKIISAVIQQVQLALKLKQPLLCGFRNKLLCRQAGVCLLSTNLTTFPVSKQCQFDYRIVQQHQVSWMAYLSLLFQVYYIDALDIASKLAKTIQYLQNCLSNFQIERYRVKRWIEQIAYQNRNQNQYQSVIPYKFLRNISKGDYKLSQKKIIAKLFHEVFNINANLQIQSHKSIKDFSIYQHEIERISKNLRENNICIISGKNTQYKDYITLQVYKQFCLKSQQPKYIYVTEQNLSGLLGQYKNGKWINGLLTGKIRKSSGQKQCIILVGNCTNTIIKLLERLNAKNGNNYLNLLNGQTLSLSPSQKIIFFTQKQIVDQCSIKVFNFNNIKFIPEDVFSFLTKTKLFKSNTIEKKFFNKHPQNFSSLQNIFLNNIDKISGSNIRMIGFKSQLLELNLIMSRFATILNAVLNKDKQCVCVANSKMLQKLYIWCLFWSIGSCLPKMNLQKLDKLLDSIKIDYDRSQSLIESKFLISQRNKTISKFIKSERLLRNQRNHYYLINRELQGKIQLIKLLIMENTHILLQGQRNSGKSSLINYLSQDFKNEGVSVAKTYLTKTTTLQQFLQQLRPMLFIQYFPTSPGHRYKICPINGKKLIIFVDNFNLINTSSSLFDFFKTCFSFGYYYDVQKSCKVIMGDICFICAENEAFQQIRSDKNSIFTQKLLHIYINPVDLSQIIGFYSQNLDVANKQKKQLLKKILPYVSLLHNFVLNILDSQRCKSERSISYSVPIWIVKQLIKYGQKLQTSCNDIISLWKFLSSKKYLQCGIMSEFRQQIQHEITYLISLTIKNTEQSLSFMKQEVNEVKQLRADHPLIWMSSDPTDYYVYMNYLLRSCQANHLIRYSSKTPSALLSTIVEKICKLRELKFYHLKQIGQYNSIDLQQKTVVYVDGDNEEILAKALATIVQLEQTTNLTFIIEMKNKKQLHNYLRFYPSIQNLAHIYDAISNEYVSQQKLPCHDIIKQILSQSKYQTGTQQYQSLFCRIISNMKNSQKILFQIKTKRYLKLKKIYNNIKALQQTTQKSFDQIKKLSQQVALYNQQQQGLINKKNSLLHNLSTLKSKQVSAQSKSTQKQTINKNIYQIDCQIKKVNNEKNDKLESINKIKQSNKERYEVYSLLSSNYKQIIQNYEICKQICENQQKSNLLSVFHGILESYYECSPNKLLQNLLNSAVQYFSAHIKYYPSKIYQVILEARIQNIKQNGFILKWILKDYSCIFKTNKSELLIDKLIKANPQAKFCIYQYQFSQNQSYRPIICKSLNFWGGSKVTIVKNEDQQNIKGQIKVIFNAESANEQFESRLIQIILDNSKQPFSSQLSLLKSQEGRLISELKTLKNKLYTKLAIENNQFSLPNTFSDIKQILDAISAVESRKQSNSLKENQILFQINKKYGIFVQKCKKARQYVITVSKLYPYINLTDEQYLQIIINSLVVENLQQQNADRQEQKECIQEININLSCTQLIKRVYKWVMINLSYFDSAYAFFLYACYNLYWQKSIKSNQLDITIGIVQSFLKKVVQKDNQILINQNNGLKNILKMITNGEQNIILALISFSQKILKFEFRDLLIQRQKWMQFSQSLYYQSSLSSKKQNIQQRSVQKLYMVLGCPQANCYQLIDQELRYQINSQQSILYMRDSDSVQQKIQMLQKIPSNQQGWIVLTNWLQYQKLKQMLQYILKNRFYRVVLFFQNADSISQFKHKISYKGYHQVCLYNKNINVYHRAKKLIERFSFDKLPIQTNKIIKLVVIQQITRSFKTLVNPQFNLTSYPYRCLQMFVRKLSILNCQELVSFLLDYFYDPTDSKNRAILKQIRKVCKHSKIPQIFDDGSQAQHYSMTAEDLNILKIKLQNQANFMTTNKILVPQPIAKNISNDRLLGFYQQASKCQIMNQYVLDKQQILTKINEIIKAPVITKQQQVQKTHPFYLQFLKQQKSNLQKLYCKKINKIKSLQKIIQSKRYLTCQTQQQLRLISEQPQNQTLQELLQIYQRINILQKSMQSKQRLNLSFYLSLISMPKEFIYSYILQTHNLAKLDWPHCGIQLRCFTDKEKQNIRQSIQKLEFLPLLGFKINNCKFDMHRCFAQCYSTSESSKLNNFMVYIGKYQSLPFGRSIPLIIKGIKTIDATITSKIKQPGFWGSQIFISFIQKEQIDKQEIKKK